MIKNARLLSQKTDLLPHHAKHSPMQPIECEIKSIRLELEQLIIDELSISIQRVWEKKSIELAQKNGERLVALYLPDFHSIGSAKQNQR